MHGSKYLHLGHLKRDELNHVRENYGQKDVLSDAMTKGQVLISSLWGPAIGHEEME